MHTQRKDVYTAGEAAAALGISVDTLRRWDRSGKIRVERDERNRRTVSAEEVDRLRGEGAGPQLSARNRLPGVVTDVRTDGLMAQVEIAVSSPVRVVAVVTRDAVEEIDLRPGAPMTAIVKATNVMLQS